jgi:hypothetical protein
MITTVIISTVDPPFFHRGAEAEVVARGKLGIL